MYNTSFGIFDIFDLRSKIGHDIVMLTPWINFEIVRLLKILQISASCYYVCVTINHTYYLIYRYVNKFFLVVGPFPDGVN